MKDLQYLSNDKHAEILQGSLESIIPAVLYYVITGRNAWHATWATQYSVGCMHLSLQSAKMHAENCRVQGSVFTIRQIPALVLYGSDGLIVLAQINTKTPFKDYSPTAVSSGPTSGPEEIDDPMDTYLVKGTSMLGSAMSFKWNSRFWSKKPPAQDSVLFVAASEFKESDIEPLKASAELLQYASYSHGGSYLLGWRTQKITIETSHVLSIASSFDKK